MQLFRPRVGTDKRILGDRENNVSKLTERGQGANTALQLYITTRNVRRGLTTAHPCAVVNTSFVLRTKRRLPTALLPSVAVLIKGVIWNEERKLCLRYRRIPIPRKILHKGGNVRYKWYRTFPRRVLLRKTSQRGFGRRSFEAAFSRNGTPSVPCERKFLYPNQRRLAD